MSDTPRLIVSLTSWPGRITSVADVIENLLLQTRLPNAIVLYLAEEQFPKREAALPEALLALLHEGKAELRWCAEDLKPHKKYFYAMQEFPEDLVVTVDDDLRYPPEMLEQLYRCW